MAREGFTLETGSNVGVIGGGPAGSFFAYFFLAMADRIGISPVVDIYEPRDFSIPGPAGCNMGGGVVYESMVQLLSTEGINLPSTVVQRGIDSYLLHMDVGSVRINTPRREKRIAAVHRGAGPRGIGEHHWQSFDGFLLDLAASKGANILRERVEGVWKVNGKPGITTKSGRSAEYDLLVGATGVNSPVLKCFEAMGIGYTPPSTAKTAIAEFLLGQETIATYLGSSMHVFLPNLPRLEFAALIPKGDYVTVCLLGTEIDSALLKVFLSMPEVKRCFPPGWSVPGEFCHCYPLINVKGVGMSFSDRMVFIGDTGVSRLYKDGIGAAYRTAKAAANTAIFHGISEEDFRRHFSPICRSLSKDNRFGRLIFLVIRLIKNFRCTRRGILRMTEREQSGTGVRRRMSGVLWDTFTGNVSYEEVFLRAIHPVFLGRLVVETALGYFPTRRKRWLKEDNVALGELGKVYRAGEVIVRQGDVGDCMYVIQSGKVEVIREHGGKEIRLAQLGERDFFGEMALFEKDVRSATVCALGDARVLTVDRKIFLRKIQDDPSLAFRIMERMSHRIRDLDDELMRLKSAD